MHGVGIVTVVMVEATKVTVMEVATKAASTMMIIPGVEMMETMEGALGASPPHMLILLAKSVIFMGIPPRSVGGDRGDNGDRGNKGANFASQGVDTNWYYDTGSTDHIT